RGDEVTSLQRFLISQNLLSADSATGFFGKLTRAAVKRFQRRHNLEQVGYVDRLTRSIINGLRFPAPRARASGTTRNTVDRTPANNTGGGGGSFGGGGGSSPLPRASCVLDGVTLSDGASQTFYSASTVAFPAICASYSQKRTCNNGTFSESNTYNRASCVVIGSDDTTAPSTPESLTATPISHTQINLAWTASTDTGGSDLAGYKVFRDNNQIATTTAPSYQNTGLTASTTYSYSVAAYDGAGNVSARSATTTSATLQTPDPTAPTAALTVNGVQNITVNVGDIVRYVWSSTNAVSAASTFTQDSSSCGRSGTGPFPWTGLGNTIAGSNTTSTTTRPCHAGHTYIVTYVARNAAGNTAASTVTVTFSSVLPAPIATPVSGTYPTAQNVALTAHIGATIRYTIGDASVVAPTCTTGTEYSTAIHVASTRTIKAIACYAGVPSAVASFAYVITIPPPVPTVAFTANGANDITVRVGDTINYVWSSTGATSAASTFTQDSSNCGRNGTGPFPWSVGYGDSPNGARSAVLTNACHAGHTFVVTYTARNVAGQTASASVTLRVMTQSDFTPPIVSIVTPKSSVVGGMVAVYGLTYLTATASDDLGVAGVQFKVGDVNIGAEDTTSPYTVVWNAAPVSVGSHTVSAIARDVAGNKTTASVNVTLPRWPVIDNVSRHCPAGCGNYGYDNAPPRPAPGWLKRYSIQQGTHSPILTESMVRARVATATTEDPGPFILFDIEDARYPYDIRSTTTQAVDKTIAHMKNLIDWAHAENPNAKVCMYGALILDFSVNARHYLMNLRVADPAWATPVARTSIINQYNALLAANDYLLPVIRKVDMFCPVFYSISQNYQAIVAGTNPPGLVNYDAGWREFVRFARQRARVYGKPLIPYIWPQYHDMMRAPLGLTYVPIDTWRKQVNYTRYNSDGAIIFAVGYWDLNGPPHSDNWLIRTAWLQDAVSVGMNATPDTTAPSVPTGVSAVATTPTVANLGQVALSWNASSDTAGGSGIDGYLVYRDGVLVADTTARSFKDAGLVPGSMYAYRVAAYDVAGHKSAQSAVVTVTTL
ncbi:MAG: fibronectin type III domain-containing protein, partial [Patescibacteria group bacterium]